MLASTFQSKLRKLNPDLRIWCGDSSTTPASIFHVVDGEFTQICAVDKSWLPDHTMFDELGRISKGGWRRPLYVLIQCGLIDRHHAQRVFGAPLPVVRRTPKRGTYRRPTPIKDAVVKREMPLEEYQKMIQKGGR